MGPHGIAKYHYDPANPNPKKFPPYYDNSVILGEFTQDTLRELKTDSQNRVFKINQFLPCGAANVANPPFTFECDNPMDLQWGADGDFYLLTYGDGFFNINADAGMYKWQYVKGQRAPVAVLTTDRTDGPLPLTVNFSSAGSSDADPGDSISFDWDFGDGTAHSIDPNPTHTYTTRGRYTVVLTVSDSSGLSAGQQTTITAGNIEPDGGREHAGRGRHVRLRRRHPVHGHRHRPGGRGDRLLRRPGHVRARPRHARARRGRHDGLLRRAAHRRRRRVARRQRVRRGQRDVHRPRRRRTTTSRP